jgi:hypothetical protein
MRARCVGSATMPRDNDIGYPVIPKKNRAGGAGWPRPHDQHICLYSRHDLNPMEGMID